VVALLALGGLVTAGCGRQPLDTEGEAEQVAEVVLSLTGAPADVKCLTVVTATDKVVKTNIDVTSLSSVTLSRLPATVVVFTVDAFSGPCTDPTVLSWTGGPQSAKLKPGRNNVSIPMRPVGSVSVSLGFDPNSVQTCAPVGSACVEPGDCCSNRCVDNPASPDGLKKCEAPPAMMPGPMGPSVKTRLDGGVHYLVYAPGRGPGCNLNTPGTDTPYVVRISAEDSVCLSSAHDDLVAIQVGVPRLCKVNGDCTPCTADACLPDSCFRPASLTGDVPCARSITNPSFSEATYYLLVRKSGLNPVLEDRKGLPRFIHNTRNAEVVITPASDQPSFILVGLGETKFAPNTGGDMCGGLGLCGIVKYTGFSGPAFGSWWFVPGSATDLYQAYPF
jgi:hypothetical protein